MIKFVEFQEVHKTTTGRGKPTSVLLSIDQIAIVRPTQHFKETSITLAQGQAVVVEGNTGDIVQTIRDAEQTAARPA